LAKLISQQEQLNYGHNLKLMCHIKYHVYQIFGYQICFLLTYVWLVYLLDLQFVTIFKQDK